MFEDEHELEHIDVCGTYELKYSSKRGEKCKYVKGSSGKGMQLWHSNQSSPKQVRNGAMESGDGYWFISRLRSTGEELLEHVYQSKGRYEAGPPTGGWKKEFEEFDSADRKSSLTATGIQKYRFEVTTERRLNLNLSMGGILPGVDDTNVVELQLLKLEAIVWGTMLMAAVFFVVFTYEDSLRLQERDDTTYLERLLPQNISIVDAYREYLDDLRRDGVASSEIRMPIIMYLLVAMVQAHEAASFSTNDNLQEMRDDKWYRKVYQAAQRPSREGSQRLLVVSSCVCIAGLVAMIIGRYLCGIVMLLLGCLLTLGLETTRIQLQSCMLSLAMGCVCKRKSDLIGELNNQLELVMVRYDGDFLDARDSRRRDELQQTLVEGITFTKFRRKEFKDFFLAYGLDIEPLIDEKIEQLHDDETNVFRLDGDEPMIEVAADTEDSIPEATQADVCCVNSRAISDMIIKLSQARRLLHARSRFRIILILSLLHGMIPLVHAMLPAHLGGGCNEHQAEASASWTTSALSRATDCYFSSRSSVVMHFVCMTANSALVFKLLSRLARCELDYYQRYWHMLYFVQMTPWSTIRDEKLRDHWGLLPTFELNTPGNVEAWNKMRLYLQSYKIKQSKHLQVSVVWCFFGVFCLFLYEIQKLIFIQTPSAATLMVSGTDTTDYEKVCFMLTSPAACGHVYEKSTKQPCIWYDPGKTCLPSNSSQQQCQGYCKVNPNWSDLNAIPCTDNQCCSKRSRAGHFSDDLDGEFIAETSCTRKLSSGWESGCEWVAEAKSCQLKTQHFDVVAMFALCDTLLFGIGLLITMWSGMKSNEIKKEGFPYIVRMKLSELLSNSMHFVSERWRWSTPADAPRGWREYEKALAQIIEKAIMEQEAQKVTRFTAEFKAMKSENGVISESRVQLLITRPQHIEGALKKFADSRKQDRHLRACLPAETSEAEPEPEPEPEQGRETVSRPCSPERTAANTHQKIKQYAQGQASRTVDALVDSVEREHLVSSRDSATLLEHALEQQHHSRTVAMLKILADTLDHEYATGGKSHWGSEDRRTKMLFISLERPLLNSIIVVVATNAFAALSAAIWHTVNQQQIPVQKH
eukprot:COSAG02_NODE_1464_length_12487_cov_122.573297_8_plen_1093_part_00